VADVKLNPRRGTLVQLRELLTLDRIEAWTREHLSRGTPIGIRGEEKVCYLAAYIRDVAGDAPEVTYDAIVFDDNVYYTEGWLGELPERFDRPDGTITVGDEVYATEGLAIIAKLRESYSDEPNLLGDYNDDYEQDNDDD
jgi:hypothetical protein